VPATSGRSAAANGSHPVRVGQLGADVDVDPDRLQPGQPAPRGGGEQLVGDRGRHAELGLVVPGLDGGVGVDLDVGVDPDGEAGGPAQPGGDRLQGVQLVGRLDVDGDPVADRQGQLLPGLADAGEDRGGRVAAGAQDPDQLPAADHVEAGPEPHQGGQHGEVGVGLDRVQHPTPEGRERGRQPPVGGRHRVQGVDVGGGVAVDQLVERQPVDAEPPVQVGERVRRPGGGPGADPHPPLAPLYPYTGVFATSLAYSYDARKRISAAKAHNSSRPCIFSRVGA
jgi:hypothetical protein